MNRADSTREGWLRRQIDAYAPDFIMPTLRRCSGIARRSLFLLTLLNDRLIDAVRFFRWSHDGRTDHQPLQMESLIAKMYHGIEKGLSLQFPRPGFGTAAVRVLLFKLDQWHAQYPSTTVTSAAIASLHSYREFNLRHGIKYDWLDAWLARTPPVIPASLGGTAQRTRAEVAEAISGIGPKFFFARHSMRQFAEGEVPFSDIEIAVQIAQKSPSVCNRQGARVYCFAPADIALRWQPGNRGFGHLANKAMVVVADLGAFGTSGERNQAFVDGGLFAMSLVYGLHALGYGTCMLAWSKRPREEKKMRNALGIAESEVIIMMIAVGCLPEKFEVAQSQRRPLSEVLVCPLQDVNASGAQGSSEPHP